MATSAPGRSSRAARPRWPFERLDLAVQHAGRVFRRLDAEAGLSGARFAVLAELRYGGG